MHPWVSMLSYASMWHKGHGVRKQSCLHYVLYTETTIFQASAWEAELLILVYVFMALSLYLKHSPCYHSEIKKLLIAYVFKYGLKMIMKQDCLKWNAAKDLQFKLGGGKKCGRVYSKIDDLNQRRVKSVQEVFKLSECLGLSWKMKWKIIFQWMRLVFIWCHPTKRQEVTAVWMEMGKGEHAVIYSNVWREKAYSIPVCPEQLPALHLKMIPLICFPQITT